MCHRHVAVLRLTLNSHCETRRPDGDVRGTTVERGLEMQITGFHEFVDANIMIMYDGPLQPFRQIEIDDCKQPNYGHRAYIFLSFR